jgi:hypothetical protein
VNVKQKQIGLQFRDLPICFRDRARTLDELIMTATQQHLQRCADHGVVVD